MRVKTTKVAESEIGKKRIEFELNIGSIDSPNRLADFYTYCGRGTGKTYAMVKSLPSDGRCVIICTSLSFRKLILDKIADIRPDIESKNIIFSYSQDGKQIYPPISEADQKLPCYIDNAVCDLAIRQIFNFHNRGELNERF